jgi:hypothetical protein
MPRLQLERTAASQETRTRFLMPSGMHVPGALPSAARKDSLRVVSAG